MRIAITRVIDVPDELVGVNALEAVVREEGFALMRELFSTLWQRFQALHWHCPKCGSREVEGAGEKTFDLLTAFGKVDLPRQRLACKQCGTIAKPLDDWLRALGEHRATWFVQELTCLAGASWPFEAAETIVERVLLGPISHEQVRQVSTAEGERVATQLAKEAQAVLEAPVMDKGEEDPQGLNVVVDGDWVKSRDNPEGMEGKVGVVYTGVAKVGKHRRKLVNRRYAVTFNGSDLLGKLVYAEASKLGVEQARRLRLLGDGAAWEETIQAEHFHRAKRVLDLWHLERRISRALQSVCASQPDELTLHREKLRCWIRQGKAEETLAELRGLAERYREVPKELAKTIGYVERHRSAIVNYEADLATGEHVGSGAVEKAGDLVINRRFKGRRGMRWWRKNADALASLRVLYLNGDWDQHWQQRRSPQPKAA